jgi:hypothetical protein
MTYCFAFLFKAGRQFFSEGRIVRAGVTTIERRYFALFSIVLIILASVDSGILIEAGKVYAPFIRTIRGKCAEYRESHCLYFSNFHKHVPSA